MGKTNAQELVVYCGESRGFLGKGIRRIQEECSRRGITPTLYGHHETTEVAQSTTVAQADLKYLVSRGDYRLYDGFLTYLAGDPSRVGYIPRLLYPEYLATSFAGMPEAVTVSWSQFGWELYRTAGRRVLLAALASHRNVKNIFVHSVGLEPTSVMPPLDHHEKMRFLPEPTYEPANVYLQVSNPKRPEYLFGFFGALSYGKGLDIYIDALRALEEPVSALICGNPSTLNFELDLEDLPGSCRGIFGQISDRDLVAAISNCRFVVMPYRTSYMFGSSGIFHQAMHLRREVIVPNFSPFSDTVGALHVGLMFSAGSADSLASTLRKARHRKENRVDLHGFEQYLDRESAYSQIICELLDW